jgi:hypothetical protein
MSRPGARAASRFSQSVQSEPLVLRMHRPEFSAAIVPVLNEVIDLDACRLPFLQADGLFGQTGFPRTHRAFEDHKPNVARALGCQPPLERGKHVCWLAPDDGLRFQRHQATSFRAAMSGSAKGRVLANFIGAGSFRLFDGRR